MDEITGILCAKIVGVGTKSEGPEYYIKPLDDYLNRWSIILVRKKPTYGRTTQSCINILIKKC